MKNPLDTIRPDIQAMHSYVVQNADGLIKLDAMENPHRLPPELQAELGRRLGAVALNRYPDNRVDLLRQALAAHAGLPERLRLDAGQWFRRANFTIGHCLRQAGCDHSGTAAGFCNVWSERAVAGPELCRRATDGQF